MSALVVTPLGSHEIRITRRFAAAPARVFAAFTQPDLMAKWMAIPEYPVSAATGDAVEGGGFRVVWTSLDGTGTMAVNGRYLELSAPDRIRHTEIFDEDWTGGEVEVLTELAPVDGGTEMTMTLRYRTTGARDAVLASPMVEGMEVCYGNLDAFHAADGGS